MAFSILMLWRLLQKNCEDQEWEECDVNFDSPKLLASASPTVDI